MLNLSKITISVSRDFLKGKRKRSPKVKDSCSSKQIDEQEYYKPAVELLYKIIKDLSGTGEVLLDFCR